VYLATGAVGRFVLSLLLWMMRRRAVGAVWLCSVPHLAGCPLVVSYRARGLTVVCKRGLRALGPAGEVGFAVCGGTCVARAVAYKVRST